VTGDLGPAAAAADRDVYAQLIADPALLDCDELYFNAGRLDRSVALASQDYLRLAAPRIARITAT
jgi:Ala-tRNA(Pro) deacylase